MKACLHLPRNGLQDGLTASCNLFFFYKRIAKLYILQVMLILSAAAYTVGSQNVQDWAIYFLWVLDTRVRWKILRTTYEMPRWDIV